MSMHAERWTPVVAIAAATVALGALSKHSPRSGESVRRAKIEAHAPEPEPHHANAFTAEFVRRTVLKDGVLTYFVDLGEGEIYVDKDFCTSDSSLGIVVDGKLGPTNAQGINQNGNICDNGEIGPEDGWDPSVGELQLFTIADSQIPPDV